MVANGDGDKSIWMTELGWSTATSLCGRGTWTGQKPAGVSEAQQAANLTEAYHCLAAHPYVETGLWFTLTDSVGEGDELDHYGLLRTDASPKPAWEAFRRYATQGDTLTGPCGDLDGPAHRRDEPDARRPLRRRAVAARGRHRSRGRRPRHVPRRRPDDPQLHGRGGRLRAGRWAWSGRAPSAWRSAVTR